MQARAPARAANAGASGTLAPTLQFRKRSCLRLLKRALWLVICLAIVLPIVRTSSAEQILPGSNHRDRSSRQCNTAAGDPLGRNTPSGTLYGFLQAAQSGNYSIAAQYLQLSAARRQAQGEDLLPS